MPLLNVENLFFSIKNTPIINDFSVAINPSEIIGILGESGSGKSTLLRLIAGLEQPSAGTLKLADEHIVPPSEKLIAGHQDIKLVRQDYGLFPNISLRENIAYELRFYEEEYRDYRIDKLLKISGLDAISMRLPREVSGGEQQRAVIARALADEPRLLLLDEPFSHLDRRNKERLKAEILTLIKEEKSACIFVTHEVSDAYGIADKLVVIKDGNTLQIDPPMEVYNRPATTYVAELTGSCNQLTAEQFFLVSGKHISSKKQAMVRPEWLKIDKKGNTAAIEKSVFSGFFYTYSIFMQGVSLQWISTQRFAVNDKIKLIVDEFCLM